MTELEQAIIDCAQLHLTQLKGALTLPNGPERSDGFTSAWWQLTGLAQLAEFHSGLSQPARDQLRAIDREAAQAVSRRPWIAPTICVPNRSARYAGTVAKPPPYIDKMMQNAATNSETLPR